MIEMSKSLIVRIKEFYIDIDVLAHIDFSYIGTIFTLITILRIIILHNIVETNL